jgi:hemerythrin superfamily protein
MVENENIITNTHGVDFNPDESVHLEPKDLPRAEVELKNSGYDGFQLLLDDHSLICSLYDDEFVNMNDNRLEQKELMLRIVKECTVHAFIEEAILYPIVQWTLGEEGSKYVDSCLKEHHLIKVDLQQLLEMDPEDPHFLPLADSMMNCLKKHIQFEEKDIYPKVREKLSQKQLRMLSYAIIDARSIAPHVPLTVRNDWLSGPNAEAWEQLKNTFQ